MMIVEDSAVVSALLEYSIGSDPRLEVCATAPSAEEALGMLDRVSPDVIAMDIRLPGMDGLEATRRIMSKSPVPIVVVASAIESGRWNTIPMEALRAGALTVLEKPFGTSNAEYQALAERLCTQLVIMSQVKLVRRNGYAESPVSEGPRSPVLAQPSRPRFECWESSAPPAARAPWYNCWVRSGRPSRCRSCWSNT